MMGQPEEHPCILSLSSSGQITNTHLQQMLMELKSDWLVNNCRFEAPSLAMHNNEMESGTRLYIMTPLTVEQVHEVWARIREMNFALDLDCAWCEWGRYKGCVYDLHESEEPYAL